MVCLQNAFASPYRISFRCILALSSIASLYALLYVRANLGDVKAAFKNYIADESSKDLKIKEISSKLAPTRDVEQLAEWDFYHQLVLGKIEATNPIKFGDLLVNTSGCKIPVSDVMYKGYISHPDFRPSCVGDDPISALNDDEQTLVLNSDLADYNCTVAEITRSTQNDSTYFLNDEEEICDLLDVRTKELLFTRCGNYVSFEARFPITSKVQEKVKYWRGKELPINVLFLGFDTASRAHFHRSLPLTMEKFKRMGFLDFKGYHSIAPYTLQNFLAFLVGMSTPQVRKECSESWGTSFDKCPLIWKDYDFNKYVTLYAEDGSQTFNWGGQGGFLERPTDYYTHPLFKALSLRSKYALPINDTQCVNHLNVQTWLLNYTTRFIKKFARLNVPFFAFSWNNDATHDGVNKLAGLDQALLELLTVLEETNSAVLKRTLVVLVSDHGFRSIRISSRGGFLERSLPGLFMRFPEALQQMYPASNFQENLKLNTRRLTTGFDIYHTLQHLLILLGKNLIVNGTREFEPVLEDRSSLLLPISGSRTCATVNIYKGSCICNTSAEVPVWENPVLQHKLIRFAIDELNIILSNSKYANACYQYRPSYITFVSAVVLRNTTNFTEGVIRFTVSPGGAIFQTRLHVIHQYSTMDSIKRVSGFERITVYRTTSWCVGFQTDEDKLLKELCTCKAKPPQ